MQIKLKMKHLLDLVLVLIIVRKSGRVEIKVH